MLAMVGGGIGMRWNVVREVIDGDTFVLGNGQKVRMLGIDAPNEEWCGAKEAREELEKMILGRRVRLEETKVDPYKRILALVYADKKLINEKMLESGWAKWDGTNNGLGERLKYETVLAKNEKRGIFGICRQQDKKNCVVKGNIQKRSGEVGAGGEKYYFFPGCSEYEATVVEKEEGEAWFCTEKEAVEAGYLKGKNCCSKDFKP